MGKQNAKQNSNPKTITFQTIISKIPSLSMHEVSYGMNQIRSNQNKWWIEQHEELEDVSIHITRLSSQTECLDKTFTSLLQLEAYAQV